MKCKECNGELKVINDYRKWEREAGKNNTDFPALDILGNITIIGNRIFPI